MAALYKRFVGYGRRLPVRWSVVALFALVLTYADGFWLTALQGAIGAIERNEPSFNRWLRDSTTMLPIVFLAVLFAFMGAHRLLRHRRHVLVQFAVVALTVALVGGAVGLGEAVASSMKDYQLQAQHVESEIQNSIECSLLP